VCQVNKPGAGNWLSE